jgi:hypothetical protein
MEEITLSDDNPLSWNLWIREHWGFLAAILCLSLLSLFFLVRDLFQEEYSPEEKFPLPPISPLASEESAISKPKKKEIPKDPLNPAKILFKEGDLDAAIAYLLKAGRYHPRIPVREKAQQLAKKYHRIRGKKKELKQKYLQGYVLFRTYPKEACGKWGEIVKTEMAQDPYYEKAKKRYERECLIL